MRLQKIERLSLPLASDTFTCLAWADSVLGDIDSRLSNDDKAGAIAAVQLALDALKSALRANEEELVLSAGTAYATPKGSVDVRLGNDQENGNVVGGSGEELRGGPRRAVTHSRAAEELLRATKGASARRAKARQKARRRRGTRRRVKR